MNAVATTMPAAPVARTETRGEPLSGDVVVSPDPEAPGRFTICQVPGSPSIWWGSRSKAVDVAQRFRPRSPRRPVVRPPGISRAPARVPLN
jgi:hypothetical protein